MSPHTERAYVGWIRRYILFHGKRHPAQMGATEVTAFLSFLAAERKVTASTQNQALSALLLLYREVLAVDLPWLDGLVRARRPARLPLVLNRQTSRGARGASPFPMPRPASHPGHPRSGPGCGCFRRPERTSTLQPHSAAAITSTRPFFSARFEKEPSEPACPAR